MVVWLRNKGASASAVRQAAGNALHSMCTQGHQLLSISVDEAVACPEAAVTAGTTTTHVGICMQVPKDRALNKIGHAMHDLDPVFRSFTRSPQMAAVLQVGSSKATSSAVGLLVLWFQMQSFR